MAKQRNIINVLLSNSYIKRTSILMDLGLKNKVAVVTGASRGIGRAIAHGFAEEGGGRLSICGRTEETLQSVTDELTAKRRNGFRQVHRCYEYRTSLKHLWRKQWKPTAALTSL